MKTKTKQHQAFTLVAFLVCVTVMVCLLLCIYVLATLPPETPNVNNVFTSNDTITVTFYAENGEISHQWENVLLPEPAYYFRKVPSMVFYTEQDGYVIASDKCVLQIQAKED